MFSSGESLGMRLDQNLDQLGSAGSASDNPCFHAVILGECGGSSRAFGVGFLIRGVGSDLDQLGSARGRF